MPPHAGAAIDAPADQRRGATAAELYLAQSQVKVTQGTFRKSAKIRFADFATEWLRDYAKGNVRERTYETYEGALRSHLIPHFGDLFLTQISRKLIDAFVADWLSGGPYYQERVRLAQEREATQAVVEGRHKRPIYLGRSPGTISNALDDQPVRGRQRDDRRRLGDGDDHKRRPRVAQAER
jgi:Phage integrase, N-terminal SAM-like domain